MKSKIAIFVLVGAAFAAGGAFLAHRQTTPEAPQADAAATFFAHAMPDVQGASHAMAQHRGKTLVVNFWATWCPPCVEEMPELSELQHDLEKQNVQVLGIGIDSAANIQEFSQKYQIAYPLYVAGMSGTELSRQLGNKAGGLPFTVLIDRSGAVRKTYLGRLKMDELRRDLAGL